MMKGLHRILLTLASMVVIATPAIAEDPPTVRVLFVGNSQVYFNGMPDLFQNLCASTGVLKPLTGSVMDGNTSLSQHFSRNDLTIALTKGAKTDGLPWDVLMLQEHAGKTLESLEEPKLALESVHSIVSIAALARQRNPNTLIVLLEIGASHQRKFESMGKTVGNERVVQQQALHVATSRIYQLAAKELEGTGTRILYCPAGQFWAVARVQAPEINLHHEDLGHPGPIGSWFSALAILGTIGGRDCIEKATWTGNVPKTSAQTLKQILLDHPEVFHNAGKR